jgi:hypothetical protein
MAQTKTYHLCGNCWKPIFETRKSDAEPTRGSGRWYHRGNGSMSCPSGIRGRRTARPSAKTVQLPAPGARS